jgi:hypothetical protein
LVAAREGNVVHLLTEEEWAAITGGKPADAAE